jgi:hypothetical protein
MPEKRIENEAAFRAANERIKESLSGLEVRGRIPFVCECGDPDCLEAVELTRDAYEKIRADDRFFMLHGHEDPAVEDVIARHDEHVETQRRRPVGRR